MEWINKGGVAKLNWCGDKKCYEKILSLQNGVEPVGTLVEEKKEGNCIICGVKTNKLALVGKTY